MNIFMPRCSACSLIACFLFSSIAYTQTGSSGTLIFSDPFDQSLDSSTWIAEIAPQPGSTVYVSGGELVLDTKGGVTVWLNKELSGNIRIEYERRIIIDSGKNDRLSDLNNFWMASDLRNPNLFTRNGILESYDSLQLYYVGMGGNTNSTTRFRKYDGSGQRTLIKEYRDKAHLLEPNKSYLITIEVKNGIVKYLVDGELFFEYHDPHPIQSGYFGFRSTKSRQAVGWIRVYQLE